MCPDSGHMADYILKVNLEICHSLALTEISTKSSLCRVCVGDHHKAMDESKETVYGS